MGNIAMSGQGGAGKSNEFVTQAETPFYIQPPVSLRTVFLSQKVRNLEQKQSI
jgi:hypothetical protein